jgi:hypothetical protein
MLPLILGGAAVYRCDKRRISALQLAEKVTKVCATVEERPLRAA